MFSKYLSTRPRTVVIEAVTALYGIILEASEGEAGNYFRKTIRMASPDIIEQLHDDTVAVMEEEKPDEPEEEWVQWLWNWFRQDFGLRNSEAVYFAPGLARIVLCQPDSDELFNYYPLDALSRNAELMKDIIHYITLAHKDEYTRYLVDKKTGTPATFYSLVAKFGAALKKHGEELMASLEHLEYTPSDYVIVELKNYETAHKYADYTDLGTDLDDEDDRNTWCYLDSEGTFNYYRQDGLIRCYLAYKPGFENLAPGDDGYGQSMLGIDIGPGNKLVHCNNRYNHEKDPELDNAANPPGDFRFDARELSHLLGCPYYKACPYYSREERLQMGIVTPEDIAEMLAKGEPINDVVNFGFTMENGDKEIEVCDLHNVLRPNNTLVFNTWFEKIKVAKYLRKPAYIVYRNDKAMICDIDGHNLLDEYYKDIYNKNNELVLQRTDGTENILNYLDGSLYYHNWYLTFPAKLCDSVYAARFPDKKIHFIDQNEDEITEFTVDAIGLHLADSYVVIQKDAQYNIIDLHEFKPLLDPWFDGYRKAEPEQENVLHVERKTLHNFVDSTKPDRYLLPMWASDAKYGNNGSGCWEITYTDPESDKQVYNVFNPATRKEIFAKPVPVLDLLPSGILLRQGTKKMLLDLNGHPLFNHWVDAYHGDQKDGWWLENDGKENFVHSNGETAMTEWYDNIRRGINRGDFLVQYNGKMNVIRGNKPLFQKWADHITKEESSLSSGTYYIVTYGDLCTVADADGNVLLDDMYPAIHKIYTKDVIIPKNSRGYLTVCIRGKQVLDGWYDRFYPDASKAIDLRGGNAIVKNNNKYNVMRLSDDPIGEWMFDRWYDGCYAVGSTNIAYVLKQDEKFNLWNTDHIEFDHWYDHIYKITSPVFGYGFYDDNDNPDKHPSVKACYSYGRNDGMLYIEYSKES